MRRNSKVWTIGAVALIAIAGIGFEYHRHTLASLQAQATPAAAIATHPGDKTASTHDTSKGK